MKQIIELPVSVGEFINGITVDGLQPFKVCGFNGTETSTWISAWNKDYGQFDFHLDLINSSWFLITD